MSRFPDAVQCTVGSTNTLTWAIKNDSVVSCLLEN